MVYLDSLKRFYALTAAVLGLDVLLHLVQRQALVGGLVSADNGGSVLDGVVREIPVELGKLSVFPDGNVGGAGGKCLRACLKTFDKNGGMGDNRKKQVGAGENASIPK